MTRFDGLLRQGLMEANRAGYESVFQTARDPDASPQYFQERASLLTDPWTWEKRKTRGKRLDWRLIALIAALLLLSACAYVVATGQFAEWFPSAGMDPEAPEVSEDVMARMGTVIGQSQSIGGVTVTLNAAVWDGESVRLSFAAEGLEFPEELTAGSWLCTAECRVEMPEKQWKDYVRKEAESRHADIAEAELEEIVQFQIDRGQDAYWFGPHFYLADREADRLTFEATLNLGAYLEPPELTLHLESLAVYDGAAERSSGALILDGPCDFTFTLEEPVPPVVYTGSLSMTCEEVPLNVREIKLSVFELEATYDILMPVVFLNPGDPPDPDKLNISMENQGPQPELRGFWTEDGSYVDCSGSNTVSGISTPADGKWAEGSAGCQSPHVIDPATVTAVDLDGTRIELDGWELLTE